jgi:type II restriction/modification system DNA methylase subunit YeeA
VVDTTKAKALEENMGLAFMGDTKSGAFDITDDLAQQMIRSGSNPNNRSNSEVIRPYVNARDITRDSRDMWIIDFGTDMSESEAALFELPFEYVKENVEPQRANNRRASYRELWWIHAEPRPAMREALLDLRRYIATPRVSKHRIFVWLDIETLANSAVIVFARDDDYFFGALHSRIHELWARSTGTQLRDAESGFRYTPTTTFETFPFPWPPGDEPTEAEDPRVAAIAQAARELVEQRQRWLNPGTLPASKLKKRTLTTLYNQNPTWLQLAHQKLDEAVLDAYGWPHDLEDEEILERLLKMNLERTGND